MKNDSVLVLNKHFLAIQVCDVKSAVCALVAGKAKVTDENYKTYNLKEWVQRTEELEYSGDSKLYTSVLRSPSTRILAPQVIVVAASDFDNTTIRVVKYSRQNVYKRDKYICQYCLKKFDKKELTIDHVIPRCKGGKSVWTNVVACCNKCNSKKGDKSPEELGWKTPRPRKPDWQSHVGVPFNSIKKDYWDRFLA